MQLAGNMSEMMSEMLGQWRRRTIVGSSRRQATPVVSRMAPYQSSLHGGGGGLVGNDVEQADAFTSSKILPVAASSFLGSEGLEQQKRNEVHPSISRHTREIDDSRPGNCKSRRSSTSNFSSGSSSINSVKSVKSRRRHNSSSNNSKSMPYSKSFLCANSSRSVHGFNFASVILAVTLILMCSVCCSSKVYNVHWNTSNPM